MVTAKELKDKYEADLKELQDKCPHTNVSEWLEHYWAPAHGSGFQVKTCNTCWKELKRRRNCIACSTTYEYEEEEECAGA